MSHLGIAIHNIIPSTQRTEAAQTSGLINNCLEEKMSKKDKKAKRKHSADGSKKQDTVEVDPVSTVLQAVPSISSEQQLAIDKKTYNKELARLQVELIKLQEWIRFKNLKVVVIFEDGMPLA